MAVKDFFDNLNSGARWDVGVSINRSNSLPLDANSVFASLEDAQNYAAGTPAEGTLANAYPGQILAVVTDAETIIYYIDANMTLQPVGNIKEVIAYIGNIPETSDAKTIIEYINSKTEGIATSDSLAQLQRDVDAVKETVGAEANDDSDATGLVKKVADNAEAIASEASARETADKAITDTIGEVAEGKTVVQMIADAQEAATYDDTQIKDDLASVKATADAAAKATDVEDLSGRVDSISDKIDEVEGKIPTVPTDVSAFNNDAGYLTAVPEEYVTEDELTAKGYQTASDVVAIVDTAIAEVNHAVFQKVDEIPDVATAEPNVLYLVPNGDKMDIYAKIGDEMVLIDDTDADLSGYAKTEDVNTELSKKVDSTDYEEKVAEIEGSLANKLEEAALDPYAKTEDVNAELAKKVDSTVYEGKVSEIESSLANKLVAEDLADYAKTADVVSKTDYDAKVAEIDASMSAKLEESDLADYAKTADVNAELKALGDKLGDAPVYEEDESGNKNLVSAGTGVYSKVYTKEEVADLIADITGGESAADVLASLNTYKGTNDERVRLVEADIATILSVIGNDESGIVKDVSDLAQLVAANEEDIESKVANLVSKDSEHSAAIEANTAAIATINEKLGGIEAGAQVNVIEGIIFNGETMPVGEDKIVEITYNLPIADADTIGGVKSSDAENKVAVAEDGTMEVNSVNVEKLVQTEGTTLILNGGSADGSSATV